MTQQLTNHSSKWHDTSLPKHVGMHASKHSLTNIVLPRGTAALVFLEKVLILIINFLADTIRSDVSYIAISRMRHLVQLPQRCKSCRHAAARCDSRKQVRRSRNIAAFMRFSSCGNTNALFWLCADRSENNVTLFQNNSGNSGFRQIHCILR